MVRLFTVGFTVVSLCLKESLAMPTRGRFDVMCTALYMMVLYDRARVGPTTKTSETIYLNLLKASVIQVMAILPNSRPSTGWRRGYLTNNCIKEIFDVGETKLRYSRTATIKL